MNAKGMAEGAQVRQEKALELRIAGGSYRQIGRQLGVSPKTAYYDVHTELGGLDTVKAGLAERLRDLELARCDRLTVALTQRANTGEPRSVFALVKVMERRAKLLGLDAPQKTDVRADADSHLLEWLDATKRRNREERGGNR